MKLIKFMVLIFVLSLSFVISHLSYAQSPTEGVIIADFVEEPQMKQDLLNMLGKFSTYLINDFENCSAPNSQGEACGCFRGEDTMANNEKGVRTNADLGMICAFLCKYAKDKITLPSGVTWTKLEELAMKSLVFSYSTHKANKLKVCKGNNYWGSTSTSDYTWESSLWAMSVAYSAFFQWDKLSEKQKGYIYNLLKAECNYELYRTIPTGYNGDTKAEENGWETNILAATLGLFPDDALASQWFDRLRAFAINCYSHTDDKTDKTVIDPDYDKKTVADYYVGANLYSDYTLQNHNLFHTSYQNVVMQELGESALALKLFQTTLHGKEKWKTNALMHNNQKVMDEVLNWLALADGELAMPNGNDWSLFLYDQITSYSTMACFLSDPNALMLENLAYKYIKARQTTTTDGSWLLRADVGGRRMGVEAHRVMMTYLMHEALSTASLTPSAWDEFNEKYSAAKRFTTQNVVRAATRDRFTCFSWSSGIQSYTGYIASNSVDKNKIIVPFRANNTGNFLGYYTVSGHGTDATPVSSNVYSLRGNSYTMSGEIKTNGSTLDHRFAIYSTPGNAVIYLDLVKALSSVTITKEQGGLMAISTDPFMKSQRTLYYEGGNKTTNGTTLTAFKSNWVNIDNELGIVSISDKQMAFGDQANNNSILCSKLYASYSAASRDCKTNEIVDQRNVVYYSKVNAETTKSLAEETQILPGLRTGWSGIIAPDPDGTNYILLANLNGSIIETIKDIRCKLGAPVFSKLTTISEGKSSAQFQITRNNSHGEALHIFVDSNDSCYAQQLEEDSCACTLQNGCKKTKTFRVNVVYDGEILTKDITLDGGKTVKLYVEGGGLQVEEAYNPLVSIEKVERRETRDESEYDVSGRRIIIPSGIIVTKGKKSLTP